VWGLRHEDERLSLMCCITHIDFPTKLLDYFLRSNNSNINQSSMESIGARLEGKTLCMCV
jgi:hypothetical protein